MLTTKTELLEKPWQERRYLDHRRKVDSALPAIDSRPPPVYSHLQLRLKRLQLEEERFAKIYKDNRRLLGRMAAIVSTKRIDNENQQHAVNAKLLARGKSSRTIGLTFSQRVINSSADSSRRSTPSQQDNIAVFDLYDSSPPYHLCRKLKMDRRKSPQSSGGPAKADKPPGSRSRSRDSTQGTTNNNNNAASARPSPIPPSSPAPSSVEDNNVAVVLDGGSKDQRQQKTSNSAASNKPGGRSGFISASAHSENHNNSSNKNGVHSTRTRFLKRPPMKYASSLVLRKNPVKCSKAQPPKVIKLDEFCDTSGCVSVTFELSIEDDGNLQVKLISKETENGVEDLTATPATNESPSRNDETADDGDNGNFDDDDDDDDDDDGHVMTATDDAPPPRKYFTEESIHSKVTEQINSSGINVSSGIDPHHSHEGSVIDNNNGGGGGGLLSPADRRTTTSGTRPSSAASSANRRLSDNDDKSSSAAKDEGADDGDDLAADLNDVKRELLEIRRASLRGIGKDREEDVADERDVFYD